MHRRTFLALAFLIFTGCATPPRTEKVELAFPEVQYVD